MSWFSTHYFMNWGKNPPTLRGVLGGGTPTESSINIAFSNYCDDSTGKKFWSFEDENPKNEVFDGRNFESKRGYRIYTSMVFQIVTKAEYEAVMDIYNLHNHRVNQDAKIYLALHADDDIEFDVKFRSVPISFQNGVYMGLQIDLEGSVLLDEIPKKLKDWDRTTGI